VNTQTLRYYERLGILKAPRRSRSGYRHYDAVDVERVAFIRRTQDLGFSLEQIRKLALAHSAVLRRRASATTSDPDLKSIIKLFEQKKSDVARELSELQALHQKLTDAIESLIRPIPACPVSQSTLSR
jgi:MerR family Zn(II)-responsive transcriptional regulator of zntA